MAKKNLPAWQQVLLTALNNVPEAQTGHDAWAKLNEAEQSAVMAFLAEHCGEDKAQSALVETCGMVKKPSEVWKWVQGIAILVALMVLFIFVDRWLEERTGINLLPFIILPNCLRQMASAWHGNINMAWKTQESWKKHISNREGTLHVLYEMHQLYTLPRRERMEKGWFASYAVMAGLFALLAGMEIAEFFGFSIW